MQTNNVPEFECLMCGSCCRNVKRYKEEVYPILKNILGENTPEFNIEDNEGVCTYLTEDNKCSIYGQRPFLCNTVYMFELFSETLGVSKVDLYKAQKLSCKTNRKHNINLKNKKNGN